MSQSTQPALPVRWARLGCSAWSRPACGPVAVLDPGSSRPRSPPAGCLEPGPAGQRRRTSGGTLGSPTGAPARKARLARVPPDGLQAVSSW